MKNNLMILDLAIPEDIELIKRVPAKKVLLIAIIVAIVISLIAFVLIKLINKDKHD